MRDREREVVYVERGGDVSAKWFLWGALAGAAVALFYAPATGEQTRRGVQRRLRKLRAMAEEKMDELTEQLGDRRQRVEDWIEDASEALDPDEDDEFDDERGGIHAGDAAGGTRAAPGPGPLAAPWRGRRIGGTGRLSAPPRVRSWHRSVWGFVRRTLESADENNVPFLASALSFDALLAVVPFVLLLLVLFTVVVQGLAPDGTTLDPDSLFHRFLPPHNNLPGQDPFGPVERLLTRIFENRGNLSLVAVPTFLWFSTRLFASMRNSLNFVYDVASRPGTSRGIIVTFLRNKLRDAALALTVATLFLINTVFSAGLVLLRSRSEAAVLLVVHPAREHGRAVVHRARRLRVLGLPLLHHLSLRVATAHERHVGARRLDLFGLRVRDREAALRAVPGPVGGAGIGIRRRGPAWRAGAVRALGLLHGGGVPDRWCGRGTVGIAEAAAEAGRGGVRS